MTDKQTCKNCDSDLAPSDRLFDDFADDEHCLIECPGASLYDPVTDQVIAGVEFSDNEDACKGYRIIDRPIYAPNHKPKRRIKLSAQGKIRRCQACQDYTVRMRRREGPDFFIPSHKHPGRTKLKPTRHTSYEPQ